MVNQLMYYLVGDMCVNKRAICGNTNDDIRLGLACCSNKASQHIVFAPTEPPYIFTPCQFYNRVINYVSGSSNDNFINCCAQLEPTDLLCKHWTSSDIHEH